MQPLRNNCWLFAGSTNQKDYGSIWNSAIGKLQKAHRFMYEALIGEIPEGLVLDHLCGITRCINPDHLEPVTNRENLLRGQGIAASNLRKTHCKHGHPLENNVYVFRTSRICKTCHIARVDKSRKNKLITQGV
jgi:hypothetical protein